MTTINAVAIAQPLKAFFTERLLRDRQASPHTIAAYRDSFRLLLSFAQHTLGKLPSALTLGDLDAPFICRFLQSRPVRPHAGPVTPGTAAV